LLALAGGALIVGVRTHVHRRLREAAARRARDDYAAFVAALAPAAISDSVAAVVYDFFAARERPDGLTAAPHPRQRLWDDHLVSRPEDLSDVLGALLVALGRGAEVPSEGTAELETLADVAVWLERGAGARARPG
jgi:hypothetical protein